jgi:hypothetical protein
MATAIAIAEALKVNSIITSLAMLYSILQDEGAIAIAEALKVNSTLECLDLSQNRIYHQEL